MLEQRQRSKDAAKSVDLEVGGVVAGLGSRLDATAFSGHSKLDGEAVVVAILSKGDSVQRASAGTMPLLQLGIMPPRQLN